MLVPASGNSLPSVSKISPAGFCGGAGQIHSLSITVSQSTQVSSVNRSIGSDCVFNETERTDSTRNFLVAGCTIFVYTIPMKNVTFTADETLIEAARRKARAANRTLNDEFRAWLEDYVARDEQAARALALIDHVSQYASSGGRRFSREEMNAR